jgi:hypothetical protein
MLQSTVNHVPNNFNSNQFQKGESGYLQTLGHIKWKELTVAGWQYQYALLVGLGQETPQSAGSHPCMQQMALWDRKNWQMKYLLQDGLKIKNSRQDVKQILSWLQNLHITDAVNWLESSRQYNSAAKGHQWSKLPGEITYPASFLARYRKGFSKL